MDEIYDKIYIDDRGTLYTPEQYRQLGDAAEENLEFNEISKWLVHVEEQDDRYAVLHWIQEYQYIEYRQREGGEWMYEDPENLYLNLTLWGETI